MLATGSERLERMRDGRVIYIGVERVDDVTSASGLPQRRAHHRGALRSEGRSGKARAVHVRGERRAHRPAMAALPHARGSGAAHARHEGDRRRHLRADRPLARPCRRAYHRPGDAPGIAQRAHQRLRRQSDPLLRPRAQERSLSVVRGDAAVRHPRPRNLHRHGARRSDPAGGGRRRFRRHRLGHEDARHRARSSATRSISATSPPSTTAARARASPRRSPTMRQASRSGRASPTNATCARRPIIR